MRVKRNFTTIYQNETDPWHIGIADAPRYNIYYDLIMKHSQKRDNILDIGCGLGAFLARFDDKFDNKWGVDVSEQAIINCRHKRRGTFLVGSADHMEGAIDDASRLDAIIYSDVICYFDEVGKHRSLEWISKHLSPDGIALIAGWCPGGKYLTPEELKRLVQRYFNIQEEILLDSKHYALVCKKKRKLVAVTVDYETWQPVPQGKVIDWERDVFTPAKMFSYAGKGVKLTFFAEMMEYLWLKRNDVETALMFEEQWRELVALGHDIQLHIHPAWIGAVYKDGEWDFSNMHPRISEYPYDLGALIGTCKGKLEEIINHPVTCFRAGSYSVQPSRKIYDALVQNNMWCDSSVYQGGVSKERGYDYGLAYSDRQPYFANSYDFQFKAPPSEWGVVELPIFTYKYGERWFLDNIESERVSKRLNSYLNQHWQTSEQYRRQSEIRKRLGLPNYHPEVIAGNDYYVLIGHTKADHNYETLFRDLEQIKSQGFEFVTLSEMAKIAKDDLLANMRSTEKEEVAYQVKREYNAVMSDERNWQQSYHLQEMIPWDKPEVLDLGCGAGYWSDRIVREHPWMKVVGIDCGEEFINKAIKKYASPQISFVKGQFTNLPFDNGVFDCVYADNVLEHAYDVGETLSEIYRVLSDKGILVAAIPSDARNSTKAICDDHTWKTAPHEVRMRLEVAGFKNIEINELNVKKLGARLFPPANNRMMFIKAWKREADITCIDRALEIMDWVYHFIEPPDEMPLETNDPKQVLVARQAWCGGYTLALNELLKREGYETQWYSMIAHNHPRGRGKLMEDSHEVLELRFLDSVHTLDATANLNFPYSVKALVDNPKLSDMPRKVDERYKERHYREYTTSFWYEKVVKYYPVTRIQNIMQYMIGKIWKT